MENVIENNRLIAEFMGFVRYYPNMRADSDLTNRYFYPKYDKVFHESMYVTETSINGQMGRYKTYNIKDCLHLKDMQFDKSYDWLMPVVERIEFDLPYDYFYHEEPNFITIKGIEDKIVVEVSKDGCRLRAIYKAVVEFIKWYNQNPQPNESNTP